MPRYFYHTSAFFSNRKMIEQSKMNHMGLNYLSFFKHHEDSYIKSLFDNVRVIHERPTDPRLDVINLNWRGDLFAIDQYVASEDDKPVETFDVLMDMQLYHIDPHSFKDTEDSDLFDENIMDTFLDYRGFHIHLKKCIQKYSKEALRGEQGISLVDYINSLKTDQKNHQNRVIFLPLTFWGDCYNKSNLLENDFENRIHLLDFPHVMSSKDFCCEKDLLRMNRPIDVFVSGTMIDWIYPFRAVTFDRVCRATDFTVFNYNPYFQKMKEELRELLDAFPSSNEVQKNVLCYRASSLIDNYYEQYYKHLRSCKLAIVGNNVFGYMARRYFEYMSNGCVCVGQLPKYAEKYGLKHMVNFYECAAEDVEKSVKFLLENDDLRIQLATNARNLMLTRYTNEILIDEMLNKIDVILGLYESK